MEPAPDAAVKVSEFVEAIEKCVAESRARAAAGDLNGAVDDMLLLEKRTRIAGDSFATSKVAVAIINLCWEMKNVKALNTQIAVLCKRRGQLKQAISDLVAASMALVDSIADREERVEVLSTLKAVTDGKIYVEVERARITRKLAAQREAEGRIAEASETLQEVQIETYGSMEKAEKADFICEQVRLAVRQADFVRAGILSNKMNRKVLDEAGFEATRVRFYRLLDLIALHKHDSLALHKHAGAVMATTGYAADAALWRPVLASSLLYLALCPWSNEVSDLIHKALADRRLEELPAQRALLMWLTTKELIPWPLPAPFGPVIQGDAVFGIDLLTVGRGADAAPAGGDAMDVSAPGAGASAPATAASKVSSSLLLAEDEGRASSWAPILRKRIAQHNVRTLAGAYTRVKLSRAASLTGVDPPTLEALLSELVSSKALYARIDRPAGVVTFAPKRAADTVLASWGDDLEGLLNLVDRTHHLIEKEAQVHGVVLTAA